MTFEYLVFAVPVNQRPILQKILNDQGRAGWELVSALDGREYIGWNDDWRPAVTDPRTQSPQEVMPTRQNQMVHKIDVKRVAYFRLLRFIAIYAIVVGLQLNI